MKLNLECLSCNINQVLKITELLGIERDKKEVIVRKVLGYLQTADYNKTNPEIMKGTWEIITGEIGNLDPYREVKENYNHQVNSAYKEIKSIIDKSGHKLSTALKIAIAGNLIDFAAKHSFNIDVLFKKLNKIEEEYLARDDSDELFKSLKDANSILYLGDNCGEVALDKLLIEYIKAEFPDLKVFFGVRGRPIVNDVTIEDAKMVEMDSVAEIVGNGDSSLGTVLTNVSDEFRKVYEEADVVIAKGQGNFESLMDRIEKKIFFLFMAKCEVVAEILDVPVMSIVCAGNFNLHNKV